MNYKLLVLDIDGTLTNSSKKITPATKEAILDIQKRGIHVVIASGRPTPGLIRFADELEFSKYGSFILSFNGARITNSATGEIIYQKTLPSDILSSVYSLAVSHGCGIMTYEDNSIAAGTEIDKYMQLEADMNHMPITQVDDFVSYVTFPVNKCVVTNEPDILQEVEKKFAAEFGGILNIYRSEPFFLEIMPKDIDKANSLAKLLERLGLTREEMICCGDGYNDLSMIKYAGLGVAMSNAQPPVKEVADFITLSNNEDGIAHVIKKFLL